MIHISPFNLITILVAVIAGNTSPNKYFRWGFWTLAVLMALFTIIRFA